MRIAIFDNLANSAYIQAKVFHGLGHAVDLVPDPLDQYAMSDPRWEELDIELPTDELVDAVLPECRLPEWVLQAPRPVSDRRSLRAIAGLPAVLGIGQATRSAARAAGWRGGRMALERAWVIRTLRRYDCVIAYGMGPTWAALAQTPCLAIAWGGDITMLPFFDTGDWEGHATVPLPGPRAELAAQAQLQRLGYEWAGRLMLADPRFFPFAARLGHDRKSVYLGFLVDTERYAPGAEPELRRRLLGDREGLIVFVPSRQDWFWKGSDRLLRGFAMATEGRSDVVLICAGWGADLARSEQLIVELGIADRVRLLPSAMSKGRLRRHYRAADVVADQFTVGSYGGSALEAMSCARPLLVALDPDRFGGVYEPFPPVMNVADPEAIAAALARLIDDREFRLRLGDQAREWVKANHGAPLVTRVLELCHEVVMEAERGSPS
ncbi:MAG: hypothetical protein DLM63_07775 [Solirubrobacterales bacterium]|nr:MAG: hypothetical protein DLM63_07775 [Solirubrobacterales bacterium]